MEHFLKLMILSFLCVGTESYGQNLIINEIQTANIDRFVDPSYNYGGWVELYNCTQDSISLDGYKLRHTDSEGDIDLCALTALHGNAKGGGYVVLWFDHNSKDGNYGGLAANQIPFKLDTDGGLLELLGPLGKVEDAVEYPASIPRCSWMRETDGAADFGWTDTPSPCSSNDSSLVVYERLQAPLVNCNGGVFTNEYVFSVSIPDSCTLLYTTDGSSPERGSALESVDGLFSGTETAIYRFMLWRKGNLSSPVVTRSFFKDDSTFYLPILSVTTAPANFFDDTIGLYVTGTNGTKANNSKVAANQNRDWERPVNVEYFVPGQDYCYTTAINQEANFSNFGGYSRFYGGNEYFEYKTSFKLKSDKVDAGQNSFAYPIFASKPYIKIKNFLVRNGGQDWETMIWDGAIQELVRTSGVYLDCQAWQPAHVFLDGKYLGMMNLREESNKQFAFSNYGISKDEIDQWEGDIVVKEGDRQKLNEWYNLSKTLTGAPSDSTVWKKISDMVDIDEYCNYMAAETYMGNLDWLRGGFKNIKGFRAKDEKGKFHIVMHDVDGGFGDTDMILQVINKGTGTMPVRFKNMLKWEPFKRQFIDAYCIMNGSVFSPMRCTPIIYNMRDIINPALALEGHSATEKAEKLASRIADTKERRPALKQSLIKAFSLTDEYNVNLESNYDAVRLLFNGQEIPTGKFDGYMFPPITLASRAPEGYLLKGWMVNGQIVSTDSLLFLSDDYAPGSYSVTATYQRDDSDLPPIRINEVSAGNDIFINEYNKKADWIELYNTSDSDYDLAGAYLSDNPHNVFKYRIPDSCNVNTIIPAHGYKVVWCDDRDSGEQLHASFKLGNEDGEFVSITATDGSWTDSLRYKEQPRWYTYGRYPDGSSTLAMFDRPTIENANRLTSNTTLEEPIITPTTISMPPTNDGDIQIVAVRYYNLNGQQLSVLPSGQIVIRQITYKDGHVKVTKLKWKQ